MRSREDLVQDDSERPHVDHSSVRIGVGRAASHLRRDVRERADLRLEPVVLLGPFGVVEVTDFDAYREDGCDQDVLEALDYGNAQEEEEEEEGEQTDGLRLRWARPAPASSLITFRTCLITSRAQDSSCGGELRSQSRRLP